MLDNFACFFCLLILFKIIVSSHRITVNSEIFIFTKSVKSHICHIKNWRLGHDLPISVNDRVIGRNREDFIFTKLLICEVAKIKNLAKKFPN